MLALAGANAVGVVLFAALYAIAGARYVAQPTFVACLAILFLLVSVLWMRLEAQHRPLGLIRRVGRAAAGLVVIVIGTPIVVLMPLYWLESHLPAEAGLAGMLPGVMALVLISLALTAAANCAGAVLGLVLTLVGRRRQ